MRYPTAKVGEICSLINGRAFKPEDWSENGTPIIRIQNLNDTSKGYNYWAGALDRQIPVEQGDVLLAWSGTPGTSFGVHVWTGPPGILNQHIFRVDLDERKITKRWFMRAVNARLGTLIAQAHGGVGLKHVTRPMVDGLAIPLPPLDEQRRIAVILDQADDLRRKRRKALELLQLLSDAFFTQLLENPATKSANVVPLEHLVSPVQNWNPAKSRDAMPFAYIDIASIDRDEKRIAYPSSILPNDAPSRARQKVKMGDVIVSTVRPNLNAAAVVPQHLDDATASTGFCILRPDQNSVCSEYLFEWIRSDRFVADMVRQATGASYPAVTDRIVKTFAIPLPPLSLQRAFAARVAQIDKLKAHHRAHLARLDALFASLQHRAFRGELSAPKGETPPPPSFSRSREKVAPQSGVG